MLGPLLVIVIRSLIPLTILRWPFWGALLAIAADASDVILLDKLGWGFFAGKDYHAIDKAFDLYYLSFELYASLSWRALLAKRISLGLFLWRLGGDVLFEVTRVRQILFFAPNIFENFYLIIAGINRFFPTFELTKKRVAVILLVAAVPKIIQEYIMHYLEFPTWQFFKTRLFFWLY